MEGNEWGCCSPCRGKGDYYRLGHGHDSHQRAPKRVMGALSHRQGGGCCMWLPPLSGLHQRRKVFAWGDNDEGQIGNDSTLACHAPQVRPQETSVVAAVALLLFSYFVCCCLVTVVVLLLLSYFCCC